MNKLNIITIGIIEQGKGRSVFSFFKKILINEKYSICYENINKNIVIFRKQEIEIFIMDINTSNIKAIEDIGIDFNIFIHNFIDLEDQNKNSLNKLLKKSEYLILNCDDDKWNLLIKDNKKSIVITYGFSNKSTVTVSSHSIGDLIETNICFQRSINTIKGNTVEPLEINAKINSNIKKDIYSAMAALICTVILDLDIILIKSSISL